MQRVGSPAAAQAREALKLYIRKVSGETGLTVPQIQGDLSRQFQKPELNGELIYGDPGSALEALIKRNYKNPAAPNGVAASQEADAAVAQARAALAKAEALRAAAQAQARAALARAEALRAAAQAALKDAIKAAEARGEGEGAVVNPLGLYAQTMEILDRISTSGAAPAAGRGTRSRPQQPQDHI